MAVSFQFCLNAILKRLFWIYYHCIEIPRIDISHDLWWLISFSPPPPRAPLGGSGGILKEKLIPFLKFLPLKTIELMYHMNFLRVFSIFAVTAAQAATAAPLGGSGGILKEKLIPFLKSPQLKTIELMYHMIFYMFFSIFAVTARRRRRQRRRTKRKNCQF